MTGEGSALAPGPPPRSPGSPLGFRDLLGAVQEAMGRLAAGVARRRLWRWSCRRWWVLVAAGCVLAVVHDADTFPSDVTLFTEAGRRLWSPDALNVFAEPIIQAGVAQLTFYAATGWVEDTLALPPFQVTSAVLQFAITFGLVALAALPARLHGGRAPRGLLLTVGGAGLFLGLASELHMYGHPAQFAVTACWVLSGVAALRRRPALAGLALALASAWEPWGLLGAPLLVLLPDTRARLRGALWLAAGTALLWAPFVLFGDFAMHHFRWAVRPHSVLAPVLGVFSPFGWPLRLLQGGLALAAGLLMAVLTPKGAHRIWSVPLVVVVVRLAVDPVGADYYWVPVKVLALLGASVFLAERDGRGWLVLPFLYPAFLVTLVPQWFMAGSVLTGMGMLVGAGRGSAAAGNPAPGATHPGGTVHEPPGRSSPRSRVPSV